MRKELRTSRKKLILRQKFSLLASSSRAIPKNYHHREFFDQPLNFLSPTYFIRVFIKTIFTDEGRRSRTREKKTMISEIFSKLSRSVPKELLRERIDRSVLVWMRIFGYLRFEQKEETTNNTHPFMYTETESGIHWLTGARKRDSN